MKINTHTIKETIAAHRSRLKDTYNVQSVGIFGSVARGDSSEKSDVDVLVEFSRPIGFFKFIELEEFLSSVIGTKVDLVTKKALKPMLKEEILRETIYV